MAGMVKGFHSGLTVHIIIDSLYRYPHHQSLAAYAPTPRSPRHQSGTGTRAHAPHLSATSLQTARSCPSARPHPHLPLMPIWNQLYPCALLVRYRVFWLDFPSLLASRSVVTHSLLSDFIFPLLPPLQPLYSACSDVNLTPATVVFCA